jgi:hypothetical protein
MYVTYYKNHAFSLNNQIKLFTWSHIHDGFLPRLEMAHLNFYFKNKETELLSSFLRTLKILKYILVS